LLIEFLGDIAPQMSDFAQVALHEVNVVQFERILHRYSGYPHTFAEPRVPFAE